MSLIWATTNTVVPKDSSVHVLENDYKRFKKIRCWLFQTSIWLDVCSMNWLCGYIQQTSLSAWQCRSEWTQILVLHWSSVPAKDGGQERMWFLPKQGIRQDPSLQFIQKKLKLRIITYVTMRQTLSFGKQCCAFVNFAVFFTIDKKKQ